VATGDEEEIAKLLKFCVKLTMVVRPRSEIIEKCKNLSAEDRKLIQNICDATVIQKKDEQSENVSFLTLES
jgi:hypothetical protein